MNGFIFAKIFLATTLIGLSLPAPAWTLQDDSNYTRSQSELFSSKQSAIPDCMDKKTALPVINEKVIQWIRMSKNQFRARGRVQGKVEKIYQDQSGHQHFSLRIGTAADAKIEVIYNIEFGRISNLREGLDAEACGDYITANAQAGGYPPSPDGAIIHWVHESNSRSHANGYVIVDGELFGGYQ